MTAFALVAQLRVDARPRQNAATGNFQGIVL
jgi:hypothetical protein